MKVYIVLKHPAHPYHYGHLEAAVIDSVHLDKAKAKALVAEKMKRTYSYLWTVKTKEVKE